MRFTNRVLVLLPALLALPACSGDDAPLDAGATDTGVRDAVADVREDAGPPVRAIVEQPLFGAMSVRNRVEDPLFRGGSGFPLWHTLGTAQPAAIYRTRRTPFGASAAHMNNSVHGANWRLTGTIAAPGQPSARMTFWIGHTVGVDAPVLTEGAANLEVGIVGLHQDGPGGTRVSEMPPLEEAVVDGIQWRRYGGVIELAYFGLTRLVVTSTGYMGDLYFGGAEFLANGDYDPAELEMTAERGESSRAMPAEQVARLRRELNTLREPTVVEFRARTRRTTRVR